MKVTGQQHATTGTLIALSGAGAIAFYGHPFSFAFASGCIIGAIAPDIDSQKSIISSFLPLIPTLINRVFGHRKFLHSPACLLLIDILICSMLKGCSFKYMFIAGFSIGYIIHLLQDTLTKGGAMWLFPFSMKKTAWTKNKYNAAFNWIPSIFLAAISFILILTISSVL